MNQQPVIILGMHRSGTTMITKILENLGLFAGAEKEINHEALFFWEINNWIFNIHTATPEKPHNLQYTNPACKKVIDDSLSYLIQSSKRKKYLGNLTGDYKSIADLDFPFGWKDPKNTFTLEFWKSVFPQPKIIHIYRNPVDSISSYIERDLILKNRFEWNWKKKLKRNHLISRHFHENFRLYNLEQGFLLWEEYVSKAVALRQSNVHFLEIQYEAMLKQPALYIRQLADFSGIKPSEQAIQKEIEQINAGRAYAFLQNEDYVAFYNTIRNNELVQQLGYANLTNP